MPFCNSVVTVRKTETLPQLSLRSTEADSDTGTKRLDLVEMNRGRLIGNLERLVLTLVAVAGEICGVGLCRRSKGPNSLRGTCRSGNLPNTSW
ncbi:MAG: hypothetical protein DMG38_18745 [Acidobacteria bacterium]|nr:MAG: hypothetical protein DMG38_18745 [Acidobacteriota bacterium]